MPNFKSDKLNHWYNKGEFKTLSCRLGSFEIFCIDDYGEGPAASKQRETILLIHGFPTSSYDFDLIWPALSHKYRLVTLDMLGFGFSDKPNHRNYTIHQQADLFEALIADLNLKSYHIVAHDYGVSVAQELLARHQEGLATGSWLSCSLLNGGLFPETHHALLIQKLMLSPAGKWINKLTGLSAFSKSFSSVFGPNTKPSPEQLAEFWEAINYKQGRHLFHNLITYILDRRQHRHRWVKVLQESASPLALINGSVDPVSGAHLVERYKELNCRLDYLKQLSDIGHYPQVEAPKAVSDAILEFIQQAEKLHSVNA